MNIDTRYYKQGYKLLAGVDEAGRGAWAGPLVSAAVMMPSNQHIRGVADSKLLTPKQRQQLLPKILAQAISCTVVSLSQTEIDQLGVHQANLFALSHCITHLDPQPDLVLIDGFALDHFVPTQRIVHGDALSYNIAAASIIAKVVRDTLMQALHVVDGRYHFRQHKGYGTPDHQSSLVNYGVSRWHRRSFAPIHKLLYT